MNIYIASSWKNAFAVKLLTARLRQDNITVHSFIEHSKDLGPHFPDKPEYYETGEWLQTSTAGRLFKINTVMAMSCDLCIYVAPSGKDAYAEVALAWAKNIPIIGITSKGEEMGLMSLMIERWVTEYEDIIEYLKPYKK